MQSPPAEDQAVPEIELYELDGIPLAHMPMPGSTILTLALGVGRSHEPVLRGGMTHLAEHLVMMGVADRLDRSLDHSNGTTEPFRVTFTMRGTPDEVSRFLAEVCGSIERLPMQRMHEEINVLRTEAAARGATGLSYRALWYRTGYQWVGTSNLPELFLQVPDEAVLRTWIAEHFVAGNAAIWIAGELPDDLLVSLPPGPRTPPPDVAWVDGLATPTIVTDQVPGIAASFFVERSTAAASALRSLDAQLRQALRVDRGLGYDIGGDYMPVNADHALATVWATCLPQAVHDVEQRILETIDDLAARGPTDDELHHQYERMVRGADEPMAVPARLDSHVRDVLLGRQPEPLAPLLDEQWRLQSQGVASAFRQARDSMLLLIPEEGFLPQRHFEPYPGPVVGPMGRGRTFELANAKGGGFLRKSKAPTLTVADAGVAVDDPAGWRLVGIPWSETVAVLKGDTIRTLICRDGSSFTIDPVEWRDGRSAINLVDQFAPPGLVVGMRA
jgi:Peptidase M16 inactive domain